MSPASRSAKEHSFASFDACSSSLMADDGDHLTDGVDDDVTTLSVGALLRVDALSRRKEDAVAARLGTRGSGCSDDDRLVGVARVCRVVARWWRIFRCCRTRRRSREKSRALENKASDRIVASSRQEQLGRRRQPVQPLVLAGLCHSTALRKCME
jgi:hypothetical protein